MRFISCVCASCNFLLGMLLPLSSVSSCTSVRVATCACFSGTFITIVVSSCASVRVATLRLKSLYNNQGFHLVRLCELQHLARFKGAIVKSFILCVCASCNGKYAQTQARIYIFFCTTRHNTSFVSGNSLTHFGRETARNTKIVLIISANMPVFSC